MRDGWRGKGNERSERMEGKVMEGLNVEKPRGESVNECRGEM